MYRKILAFVGLSLVNPLCMLASFIVCMGMGAYERVGAALEQFDLRFVPVYLAVGMFVLLLQLLIVYGIARTVYRGSRMTMANVTQAFLLAQRPFYFFIVAVPVLMTTIEDNAVVFGAIFAFPFVAVAGVFAIQRMRRSLRALAARPASSNAGDSSSIVLAEIASAPSDRHDGALPAIARTLALAVIASV
jgi:hypothetical protein